MFRFLLLCLLFSSALSAQQAWVQPKGHLYAQLGGSYIGYGRLLNGNGDLLPVWRRIDDVSVQLYGTYGVTKRLSVNANIPLKILASRANLLDSSYLAEAPLQAKQLTFFGNITLGASYAIVKKGGFAFAGHLHIHLPNAKFHAASGLRTGVSAWGFQPSLALGFGHKYFFVSSEFGCNYRTQGYSTQLFSYSQLGTQFSIGKSLKFYLIVSIDLIYSLHNGDHNEGSALHTGLYLSDMQFQAPSLKLGLEIGKQYGFWVSTGGLGLAGGKSLGVGPSVSLSFFYRYQPKKSG